jgi:hypothetical protein
MAVQTVEPLIAALNQSEQYAWVKARGLPSVPYPGFLDIERQFGVELRPIRGHPRSEVWWCGAKIAELECVGEEPPVWHRVH